MSIYGQRVLRVRLERGAPSFTPILVHAAAASLEKQGMRVVDDDIARGTFQDELNPKWTDDDTIGDVVRLFAGGDPDDHIRDRMVEAWAIAFSACLDLVNEFDQHVSVN